MKNDRKPVKPCHNGNDMISSPSLQVILKFPKINAKEKFVIK